MDSESQLRFNSRKQTISRLAKVAPLQRTREGSILLLLIPFSRAKRTITFCKLITLCGTFSLGRCCLQLYLRCLNCSFIRIARVFSSFTAFLNSSYNNFTTVFLRKSRRGFSSEEVSSQNQVKASVQRKIRQSIADEYPGLEPVLDDLLPKKSPLIVCKWCVTLLLLLLQLLISQNHLNLVLVNNVPLFFNIRDGPYMPTLRLLHQYPNIMKKLQVDRGAIRFVLAGANIMCPGLTSPGGALDEEVEAETPVVHTVLLCFWAIMAEGKQHALAIGFTKMSAKDIKAINKGIGVDNMHYLNDGLWKMERLD
ncbi:hypothetical protein Pint_19677 [Pistacia integerrima]|uniref:Uncharacterized protein n=1 Tax=Pistacia integerrima TaxID=434235 RepID=A0ACC0XF45_9ROSI|nr:hypothetical protein Pint_19677 [Pistacia integerrima]